MRLLARILGPMPFARLSATHAVCNFADSFFAVSLAGSLFFNVSVGAARPRVIAYLLVTLAPFVFLAPVVGPLIDRFARTERVVAAATLLGRGILCLFVAGDIRNLLLYPEVFAIPRPRQGLFGDQERARPAARPRRQRPGGRELAARPHRDRRQPVQWCHRRRYPQRGRCRCRCCASRRCCTSPRPTSRCASRPTPTQPLPEPEIERVELRVPSVRAAAAAMGVLRGATGFLVFLVAFGLKRDAEPLWFFGAVAAASVAGGFIGHHRESRVAQAVPSHRAALRRRARRRRCRVGGRPRSGAPASREVAAVFAVALGANIARQSFDSVLQRDAPEAARGRAFARFETLFQLVWVIGALLAVVLEPSLDTGSRGARRRLRPDGRALRDVPQERRRADRPRRSIRRARRASPDQAA